MPWTKAPQKQTPRDTALIFIPFAFTLTIVLWYFIGRRWLHDALGRVGSVRKQQADANYARLSIQRELTLGRRRWSHVLIRNRRRSNRHTLVPIRSIHIVLKPALHDFSDTREEDSTAPTIDGIGEQYTASSYDPFYSRQNDDTPAHTDQNQRTNSGSEPNEYCHWLPDHYQGSSYQQQHSSPHSSSDQYQPRRQSWRLQSNYRDVSSRASHNHQQCFEPGRWRRDQTSQDTSQWETAHPTPSSVSSYEHLQLNRPGNHRLGQDGRPRRRGFFTRPVQRPLPGLRGGGQHNPKECHLYPDMLETLREQEEEKDNHGEERGGTRARGHSGLPANPTTHSDGHNSQNQLPGTVSIYQEFPQQDISVYTQSTSHTYLVPIPTRRPSSPGYRLSIQNETPHQAPSPSNGSSVNGQAPAHQEPNNQHPISTHNQNNEDSPVSPDQQIYTPTTTIHIHTSPSSTFSFLPSTPNPNTSIPISFPSPPPSITLVLVHPIFNHATLHLAEYPGTHISTDSTGQSRSRPVSYVDLHEILDRLKYVWPWSVVGRVRSGLERVRTLGQGQVIGVEGVCCVIFRGVRDVDGGFVGEGEGEEGEEFE